MIRWLGPPMLAGQLSYACGTTLLCLRDNVKEVIAAEGKVVAVASDEIGEISDEEKTK